MKRALSILLSMLMLSGAFARGESALPQPESPERSMLLGETAAEYFYEAALYYIGTDGVSLSLASRTLLVRRGESLVETVLHALFNPSGSPGQISIAPGDTKLISCELAGGIATVNLSTEARNVQGDQDLWMMYSAIAGTLAEIDGVEGANILINDRQEGILQMPIGVLSAPGENIAAAWAQLQAESDRYLGSPGGPIARTAVIYYPSRDGARLVPEARALSFTQGQCATSLIAELCAGPDMLNCAQAAFPEDAEPLSGSPVLTVTPSGERVLEVNLSAHAVEAAERRGVARWQLYGALALSLCSFVPELDAVRLSVDGAQIEGAEHPAAAFSFDAGLMRRRDFATYIGAAANLYLADADGNLALRQGAMSRGAALSPRALLEALFSDALAARLDAQKPVPQEIVPTDILGVRVAGGVATVNLSARFYSACQALDELRERTAVYAIVNTLCQLEGINGVSFLIEGSAVENLSENIYFRSTLLPSPGVAVTG